MSRPADLVQGTFDLLILKILALEPLHGWAISHRLKSVSSDVLPCRCLVVLLLMCLLAGADTLSPQVIAQAPSTPIPLPVTSRTRPANGHVFDRPSIIVLLRVFERAEIEKTDMDGMSLPGAEKKAPFRTYVTAQVVDVLRVNERDSYDPDLKDWHLIVEQYDREERPIRLEFARSYVMFLVPSPTLMPLWNRDHSDVNNPPPYAFAIPQGGFEFVDGKAKPLVKGGPLDKYAGMPKAKLLEEIRKQ